MHKDSIEIENAEINKTKVDFIKKIINKLQKTVDYVPKDAFLSLMTKFKQKKA